LTAALLAATPAAAQRQRAVTDETVTMGDVAKTPLSDLNLSKDPIPPVLLRAAEEPYRNYGLNRCDDIRNEIGDLDAVLGEDMDLGPRDPGGANIGKVAQSLVGMLIPYRGLIRNLSGAERHQRAFQEAIAAGMMRRAYLKGLGQAKNCPYPARPAPPEMIAAAILKREEAAREQEEEEATGGREVPVDGYVSEPVVQQVP
jgi:hypothetical protein